MSDTGELGPPPGDTPDDDDIDGDLTPGDFTDGELQAEEIEQERETWGDGPSADETAATTS